MVPNQSENGTNNLILVDSTGFKKDFFLCASEIMNWSLVFFSSEYPAVDVEYTEYIYMFKYPNNCRLYRILQLGYNISFRSLFANCSLANSCSF